MTDGFEFTRDGEVARLMFSRPEKMNAITYGMWSAIPDVVARVEADPAIKVLVLTGAGAHFSAGADISEFRDLRSTADAAETYDKAVDGAVAALAASRKPTVAMIQGNCIGGGCQIAVACDFRFAAEGSRFGITPSKLGIVYHFDSTRQLISLVGPAHAKYFLLSGELVDARRAREIGLLNDVFPAEELESSTMKFVETLASRSQASVRGMNRIIEKIVAGQEESDAEVDEIRLGALHGEDYAEGVAAFLARRPPKFTYR
ncbi:enoyl-CoA hydratase/isomerase family protein [Amycolatopsis regifaucium]|uniref:Enoyl-CoA hydratase n=1 Tax=Amycolatopsis regifaucium TaxID=546365 RepID=A0A154MPV0_9PSEU|nr:enoyl-CoA hydratase-related protein [Amycolatopsis regifaucium]KZB86324.1 enoyl-CoA hydratase [Amycolatopsis regifaucium]OKA05124.1 enoyl-CoA hydratase [Amycolatopsis regifaucium]SFH82888.1 Enoyl-CoA hydratase/carnithine racemase [Amycolatopsis regifaucium]